jgi:ATP-dependent exoDNAse (exonuclease V) beta subunit
VIIAEDDWSSETSDEINLIYVGLTRSKFHLKIESNLIKELLKDKLADSKLMVS